MVDSTLLGEQKDGNTYPHDEPNVIRVSPRLFPFGESPVGSNGEQGNMLLIVTLIHEDIHLHNYDDTFWGRLFFNAGNIDHEALEGIGGLDDINLHILMELALLNGCK